MTATPSADARDTEPIVEFADLRRSFVVRQKAGRVRRTKKIVHAVDGVSVRIGAGEACGYIGANGAGKSTTIKMITGILVPTSGTVRTCGLDPVPQRRVLAREIGVVFGQRSQLWWDLPLRDSFKILAAIHRLDPEAARVRTDRLVDGLGIVDQLDTPVRQLSLGERMRGEVAAALVHSPRLLVLDEPTIGLDMISKERLRHFLITERAERGTTLLLTTHGSSVLRCSWSRPPTSAARATAYASDSPSHRMTPQLPGCWPRCRPRWRCGISPWKSRPSRTSSGPSTTRPEPGAVRRPRPGTAVRALGPAVDRW
jgi:ABC-type Na+ transport system ATPase subunit NatA